MSEENRYSKYSDIDCPVYDKSPNDLLSIDQIVESLNAYESRVKELEQAIEKAIDNINCDASEAAMRPLIELMEGK